MNKYKKQCPECRGDGVARPEPGIDYLCPSCCGSGKIEDPMESPAKVMQGPLEIEKGVVCCGQCEWFGNASVCRVDEDGDEHCPDCGSSEIYSVMMGKSVLGGCFIQKQPNQIYENLLKMEANPSALDVEIDRRTHLQTLIQEELTRAKSKFPQWPTDPMHALGVLSEEHGEVAKDCLQLVYEPSKTNLDNLRKEVIQLAAMCHRFLESLDRYEFKPSAQHSQS